MHALNSKILNCTSVDEIVNLYKENLSSYHSKNLLTSIYSISKSKTSNTDKLTKGKHLFDHVTRVVDENKGVLNMQSRHVFNMLWAYAKVGRSDKAVFDAVDDYIRVKGIDSLNSHDISNAVWSFATVHRANDYLFSSVSQQIQVSGFDNFKKQEIACIIWSYGKLQLKGDCMFDSAVKYIINNNGFFNAADDKKYSFQPKEVALILSSFANVGREDAEMFDFGMKYINSIGLIYFSIQDLSTIVISYTKGKYVCMYVCMYACACVCVY